MHPAHRQDVTATLSGSPWRNDRDVSGPANLRVGGAVDEAGDIAPAEIGERRLLGGEQPRRRATASAAARALCQVTSGSAPLIHSHASCWVAGAA